MPMAFLANAADILADTIGGLSGSAIVKATRAYAADFGKNIPHAVYPYEAPNKRQALLDNLVEFDAWQQFKIIRELCDHPSLLVAGPKAAERKKLKVLLFSQYGHLAKNEPEKELDLSLVEETKHWLQAFPPSLKLYEQAKVKYDAGIYQRNLLDDLRLALELLLKDVLGSQKSLENLIPQVGALLKDKGGSPQFANMFEKLVDYYTKYNNASVKHADAVKEEEIEFVFEITSSFMKHIVRVSA
jgi:hypothetical protein